MCREGTEWPYSLMKTLEISPEGSRFVEEKRTIRCLYWGFILRFCLLACREQGLEPITRGFEKWTNCFKEEKQLHLCPKLLKCVSFCTLSIFVSSSLWLLLFPVKAASVLDRDRQDLLPPNDTSAGTSNFLKKTGSSAHKNLGLPKQHFLPDIVP